MSMETRHGPAHHFYPLFLDLAGRPALVAGGGTVAERKLRGLFETGARLTVIAPAVTEEIERLHSAGRLELHRRGYRQGDCLGFFLVYAATDDPEVNRQVCSEAAELGLLCGSVDGTPAGGFSAPAVIRRGPVTLTVSSEGQVPALTAALRQYLERKLYPELGNEAEELAEERRRLLGARGEDGADREEPGGQLRLRAERILEKIEEQ